MSGGGLFDVAERFGVSAAEIISSTENEVQRRWTEKTRELIVEARRANQPTMYVRSLRGRTKKVTQRDRLIELSLKWQDTNRASVAVKR
jgi:hypothetical protein